MSMPTSPYHDRSGADGAQVGAVPSEAGWYPDPHPGIDGMRWWDGTRWTDHGFLRSARDPALASSRYRASGALARWAVAATLLVLVVQAALAFSVDSSYERVQQAALAHEDLGSLMTTYDVLGFVSGGAFLLAWLVNAAWLARSRANAEALAPGSPHRRSAGWAWGAWVCPFVNFWFPYQVVRDVSRATRPRAGALVGAWWAAFLAMGLFSRVASSVSKAKSNSAGTEWDDLVSTVRDLQFASLVIAAVAAVAWIAVVERIDRDQRVAAAALMS